MKTVYNINYMDDAGAMHAIGVCSSRSTLHYFLKKIGYTDDFIYELIHVIIDENPHNMLPLEQGVVVIDAVKFIDNAARIDEAVEAIEAFEPVIDPLEES